MGRLTPLLLAACVLMASLSPAVVAHRHLFEDAAPPPPPVDPIAAAAAVTPASEVAQEEYLPTNPEAAAAYPQTEVTLADAVYSGLSRQSAANLSDADVAALQAIASQSTVFKCGAPNTNRSTRLAGERLTAARLRTRKAAGVANTAVPQVNVWFHVVRSGLDITQGNIPDSWITAQLDVLNGAFVGRFRFNFMGTTRTTNAAWHPLPDAAEFQMKQSLRRGTAATLNFFITRLDGGLLGYAYYPTILQRSNGLVYDSTVVTFTTLPGAPTSQNNMGDVGVHEVGHWLNLFHTFEGGCTSSNDMVADTPAETNNPIPRSCGFRDTCPSLPGADPTTNYMSYVPDSCMNSFTNGQFTRMMNAWNAWRASSAPPPTPSPPTGGCSRVAAPGGACGAAAGNVCCPSGQCCSQWGWCGITTAHCGSGCQRTFGTCS